MSKTRFLLLPSLLGLLACGGGDAEPDAGHDAAALHDAASIDDAASTDDAHTPPLDAGAAPDDAARDAQVESVGDTGLADDVGPLDAAAAPDTGCTYLDDPLIVRCADRYRYVRTWSAIEGSVSCPPYATGVDGARYATLEDAIAASSCDAECVWRASVSFTVLRCGHRSGYIEFRAEGCDSVIETPDGIFASTEEWNEAAPCP